MASVEELPEGVRRLRGLGLSEYAARVYSATLKLGKSDARSISSLARVPPSKIYEVLGNLEANGLLEVFPEFPKKYAARSLDGYLDRLLRTHHDTARRIEEDREALLRMFEPTPYTSDEEKGSVLVVHGGRRILERVRGLLNGATRDWLVLGVPGTAERYQEFLPELTAAQARGVKLRFLLPATPEIMASVTELASIATLRHRELPARAGSHVAIVVADGQHALLVHWGTDEDTPGGVDVAILTDQQAMVDALGALVETLWSLAAPLQTIESEKASWTTTPDGELIVRTRDPDVAGQLRRVLEGRS